MIFFVLTIVLVILMTIAIGYDEPCEVETVKFSHGWELPDGDDSYKLYMVTNQARLMPCQNK